MEKHFTVLKSKGEIRQNRVFVIDDDCGVGRQLQIILESRGFRVDTFLSAVDFLASGGAARIGCVLTDVQMPGMNGLELQKELRGSNARLAVIVMAGSGLVTVAVEAMKAGAIDFLEKPFSEEVLVSSVRRALEIVSLTAASSSLVEDARRRIASLTRREKDVFDLVVGGSSNKIAARALHISPRTVEIHRARAIDKLGAKSLADLVRMSIAGTRSHRAA